MWIPNMKTGMGRTVGTRSWVCPRLREDQAKINAPRCNPMILIDP